jgi:hypothetical protein
MQEFQHAGMRNLGMVAGSGGGKANDTPTRTIAGRLESTAYTLMSQCARIEDVLARINGTPRNPPQAIAEKDSTAAAMAQSVEALEQQVKRLCDLANNLEQVA